MIEQFAQKIVTAYDNLPPKKKALADMLVIVFGVLLVSSIVGLVAHFGLWIQFLMFWFGYFISSMIYLIYKSRVAHYEFQEKYGNK